MSAIQNRYDFVYLFDVQNGNPNGDPDNGNMPRQETQSQMGLVTDVCLKRKVRNYVQASKNGPNHNIYMQERAVLNRLHGEAYTDLKIEPVAKKLPKEAEKAAAVTKWMCDRFYDIRTFGAVMTTDVNCGQVRGPVQMTFAESVEPITPQEITITRSSVTNEKDADKERTMGRKHIVPYALYRGHGFISASLAERTGFSDADLELFWDALNNMFENDRSAARGLMGAHRLIVFKHATKLGNAQAQKLFARVKVVPKPDVALRRRYDDYDVTVDASSLPPGVEILELIV